MSPSTCKFVQGIHWNRHCIADMYCHLSEIDEWVKLGVHMYVIANMPISNRMDCFIDDVIRSQNMSRFTITIVLAIFIQVNLDTRMDATILKFKFIFIMNTLINFIINVIIILPFHAVCSLNGEQCLSHDNSQTLSSVTTTLGPHMKSGCGKKPIDFVGQMSNI